MCRACQKNKITGELCPLNRKAITCICTWRAAEYAWRNAETNETRVTKVWVTYPVPCFSCLRALHRLHPTEPNTVVDVYGNRYKMKVPASIRDE